jgi:hypothetical protein
MRRAPSLRDTALAALHFASDVSAYVTGISLPIEGGTLSRIFTG